MTNEQDSALDELREGLSAMRDRVISCQECFNNGGNLSPLIEELLSSVSRLKQVAEKIVPVEDKSDAR